MVLEYVWYSFYADVCWGHVPWCSRLLCVLLFFTVTCWSSCVLGLLLSSCVGVSRCPRRMLRKKCCSSFCVGPWMSFTNSCSNLANNLSNFWSGNAAIAVEFLTWKRLSPALHRLCAGSGAEGTVCSSVQRGRPSKKAWMYSTVTGLLQFPVFISAIECSEWLTVRTSQGK